LIEATTRSDRFHLGANYQILGEVAEPDDRVAVRPGTGQASAIGEALVKAGLILPADQPRVEAIVRRLQQAGHPAVHQPLEAGPIRIEPSSRRVTVGGRSVSLTRVEFALLAFLVDNPRVVFDRDQLLERVWGYTTGSTATVTVHIRRLRSKIETDPMHPELIKTVSGAGYLLDVPETITGGAGPG